MNTLFSIHDELLLVGLFAKRQDVHLFFGGMTYYINNNTNLTRITIDMKTQKREVHNSVNPRSTSTFIPLRKNY